MAEEPGYADLAPPITVRLAAGLHAVSGIYLALSAIQLLITVVFYGPLAMVQFLNWFLIALGVFQVVIAARLIRMRKPWELIGLAVGAVTALAVTGWMMWNISLTIFSCMQLGALVFAWAAVLATPLTLGPIARADAARKKLEEGGMGLGL